MILGLVLYMMACNNPINEEGSFFVLRESRETGLDFENRLDIQLDLNILNYLYYYNGGGLAAGDFNNDGLVDLYFTSNLGEDKMFLNKGGLEFEDISANTAVDAGEGGWTTGAAVVDINNDGLLDIYVCQVGKYLHLDARNILLVCQGIDENGIPQYRDEAAAYGLDFQGFSTQAGFFDYDLDGDLDMFLLNHSVHQNNTYGKRVDFLNTYHDLSGDRLYRNDNGRYVDVTKESGIHSNVIGYGLGLAFGDFNQDGYPDIYVANDFHENDYLYINQKDGSFTEELTNQMGHCSKFSMGCDVADVNNDAYPDIFTLDMLPEDPEILKRSGGEETIGVFNFKLIYGYFYQYAANCLHINNHGNNFSEIARYSGVEATDWSWSPLLVDLDLDGHKDLFVANGIPRRANDLDYINYYSSTPLTFKVKSKALEEEDLEIISLMPEIKLRNKLYLGSSDLVYEDIESLVQNNMESYSNSAIYADLDNDGDYDIVTNNINQSPFVYENTIGNKASKTMIKLLGSEDNRGAIGAKVIVYIGGDVQYYEHYTTRAFQSSSIGTIIAASEYSDIDSMEVIWPDNSYECIKQIRQSEISVQYSPGLPSYDYEKEIGDKSLQSICMADRSESFGLALEHIENEFVEFHREPLILQQTSDFAPALAVGDINGDGLDDLFLGSSKGYRPQLMIQTKEKGKSRFVPIFLDIDSAYEEVDASIMDFDGDGHNDLLIAIGGNEYPLMSRYNRPLLYINDGKGGLEVKEDAFSDVYVTACGLAVEDFDNDGDPDIFLGGRAVPYSYGEIPHSYLLVNDGTGRFIDVTEDYAPGLSRIGMVKSAIWMDINEDGVRDLVVAIDWGVIKAYVNNIEDNQFVSRDLVDKHGWWTFMKAIDYDGDGDQDLLLGNLGRNSRFSPSPEEPVSMYYSDFDENGHSEQLITYYVKGREVPFSGMSELHSQLPYLKSKFQFAKDFAKASIRDLIGSSQLDKAIHFTVDYADNAVLINQGGGQFELTSLPLNLQTSTYMDALEIDMDGDRDLEMILGGNYYGTNVQLGRYDSDYGTYLDRKQDGSLCQIRWAGDLLQGQVRNMKVIDIDGHLYALIAINDGTLKLMEASPKGYDSKGNCRN